MKKYLGILLLGLLLISGTTVFAQTSGSGIFAVEVVGSPTTWTQGTNKNVTWQSAGVGTKFDVLVCYLRASQSDACFFAYQNLTNTGSAVSVRVGTNVPLNSMAYVKVRKAGTDTVMAKSPQFRVVPANVSTLEIIAYPLTPAPSVVIVDDVNNTDGVVVLRSQLKANGNSDLVLNKLPLTFNTIGGAGLSALMREVELMIDGEILSSKVVTSSSTSSVIVFDDLDFVIEAGTTVEFTVLATMNDIEAGSFDEGDILRVDLTSVNRAAINVVNENGVQLTATQKTGLISVGQELEFRSVSILPKFVRSYTSVTRGELANDDIGNFEITFDVKSLEDNVYLSSKGTAVGYTYRVEKNGMPVTSASISGTISSTADRSSDTYIVQEEETERFTLRVAVPLGSGLTAGQYRLVLTGIKWDTDMDSTPDNSYATNFSTDPRQLALDGDTNQMASVIASLENLLKSLKQSLGLSN